MFAQKKMIHQVFTRFIVTTLSLSLLLSGCRGPGSSQNAGVPGQKQAPQFKSGFNLMSPQQDIEIGRRNAMQVEQQQRVIRDPDVQNYITTVGQRIAAKAPGEKFPYQFKVVDTKEVNAFALPGGFLYVNRGTIEAAKNEAELVGVMAHEISHAALRHGTNQMSKQMVAEKGLNIAAAIFGSGNDSGSVLSGQLIGMLGSGALNIAFLKFSRTAEKQADITGAEIMAAAGYDPRALASFFKTLLQSGGSRPPEMLSDHPDPGNRVQYITDLIPKLNVAPNAITDTPAFEQVRAKLRGLPGGASRQLARQGAPQQSVQIEPPSAQMAQLTAPDKSYQIAIPSNWQQITDGEHLIFAPKNAAGRSNEGLVVTHGMFVGTFDLPQQLQGDLGKATQAFVRMQLASNPEMQPLANIEQTSIGGRTALYTPVGGDSPITGRPERDVIVTTILPNGKLFYVVLISPQDEAPKYSNAFKQALGSIRFAG